MINTNYSGIQWPMSSAPYRMLFAGDPQYAWAEDDITAPSVACDGKNIYMIYQCVQTGNVFTSYSSDAQNWLHPIQSSQLFAIRRPAITYDPSTGLLFIVYMAKSANNSLTVTSCTTSEFIDGNINSGIPLNIASNGVPGIAMLNNKLFILYTNLKGINSLQMDWNNKQFTSSPISAINNIFWANISLTILNGSGKQLLAAVFVSNNNLIYMDSSDGVSWENVSQLDTATVDAAAIVPTFSTSNTELPTIIYIRNNNGSSTVVSKITQANNGNWGSPEDLQKQSTDYPAAVRFTAPGATSDLCIIYKATDGYNFLYSTVASGTDTPSFRTQINKPNNSNGPSPNPNQSKPQIESVFNSMVALKSDSVTGDVKCVMINGDITGHRTKKERLGMQDMLSIIRNSKIDCIYGLGNHDYINNVKSWDEDAVNMVNMLYSDMSELPSGGVDITRSNKLSQIYFKGTGLVYAYYPNIVLLQFNYDPYYATKFKGSGNTINHVDITEAYTTLQNILPFYALQNIAVIICMHNYDPNDSNTPAFNSLISEYNVTAVFAGHIHQDIGLLTTVNSIPIFRCGASTYQNYLEAAFDFNSNQMTVSIIMNELDGTYRRLPSPTVWPLRPVIIPTNYKENDSNKTKSIQRIIDVFKKNYSIK